MLSECKFGSKIGARSGESESHHEKLDPTSDLVTELNKYTRIYRCQIMPFQCILTRTSWAFHRRRKHHRRPQACCKSHHCPYRRGTSISPSNSHLLILLMELRPGTTPIPFPMTHTSVIFTKTGNNYPFFPFKKPILRGIALIPDHHS